MVQFTRRTLLRGALSTTAVRVGTPTLAGAGSILLFSTRKAHAFIMAAIAVASMVASMIANHNRTDGGVGAILSANNELLTIALSKLNDIQNRLTDLFKEFEQLPNKFDRILKNDDTRKLQVALLAVVQGYLEKLKTRDPSLTDEEWRREPSTRRDLRSLLERLQEARQRVEVQKLLDPATAMVATSLGFVEANLKNFLGDSSYEIAALLRTVYLPWYDEILDPVRVGSTAAYTQAASDRLKNHMKKASENAVGRMLGMKAGSDLMSCVGVNDFRPEKKRTIVEYVPCGNALRYLTPENLPATQLRRISLRGDEKQTVGHRLSDQSFGLAGSSGIYGAISGNGRMYAGSFRCPEPGTITISARRGPDDRLAEFVTLQETDFVADGKQTGVLLYSLPPLKEIRASAGNKSLPPDSKCAIQTHDMPNGGARLAYMKRMPQHTTMEKAYQELSHLIDEINDERTRVAFGARTSVAVQIARRNIAKLISEYS